MGGSVGGRVLVGGVGNRKYLCIITYQCGGDAVAHHINQTDRETRHVSRPRPPAADAFISRPAALLTPNPFLYYSL